MIRLEQDTCRLNCYNVQLEEDYLLQGENGPVKFSSLFSGDNNNLVVYHMMMDEGAEKACHLCSFWFVCFHLCVTF